MIKTINRTNSKSTQRKDKQDCKIRKFKNFMLSNSKVKTKHLTDKKIH